MSKRKPAYGALFVIGLAFLPLAIAQNMAFLGVGVAFLIIGAAGLARERRAKDESPKQ